MQRGLLVVFLGCILLMITGCGGCGELSQADMRARAIRRNSAQEEEKEEKKQPAPPAKPLAKIPPKTEVVEQRPANQPSAAGNSPNTLPAESRGGDSSEKVVAGLPEPVSKPANPLGDAERRRLTIENMTALGKAFVRYLQTKGTYPTNHGTQLSWRVMLLPYIGEAALFDQFHLDEPWDSAHNKSLLARIPKIYRSPERFDEKTNYLLLVDGPSAFSSSGGRPVTRRLLGDGLSDTLILAEVADTRAVPWTQPQDFDLDTEQLQQQLATLRSDGLFAIWADGRLGVIPNDISPQQIRAMLTPDAGDQAIARSGMARVSTPKSEPPAEAAVAAVTPGETPGSGSLPETGLEVVDPLTPPPTTTGTESVAGVTVETPTAPGSRRPLPGSVDINKAKVLLEEIYRPRIDAARNREQQARLAQDMLADLSRLQEDPAGQYALLEGVRRIALDASDATTALKAVEELGRRFEVDTTSMRIETISEFARSGSFANPAANEIVLNYAVGLMRQSLAEDNFDGAQKMYDIAIAAARRVQKPSLVRQLQQHKEEVDVARAAYAAVENVLDELDVDPYAPKPNLAVGKYYCFVKGDWSRGLPMLARGDDDELRTLAEMELDPPVLADKQLELAERWWDAGEKHPMPMRRQMQLRGVNWYQKSHSNLPEGLKKIKVEVRLREAQRVYGRSVLGNTKVAGSKPS